MSIIVDCSVALAWYLPDESSALADAALRAVESQGASAPVHFKAEFANGLTMAVRRKRISPDFRTDVLQSLGDLGIDLDLGGMETVWTAVPALADKYELTIYDALYLEQALRQRQPLATLDKSLRRAALSAGATLFDMGA